MYLRFFSKLGSLLCCISYCLLASCGKQEPLPNAELISVQTTNNLYDVLFVDSLQAYIVGGDRYASSDFLVTEDGGQTWSLTHLPPDANKAVYAVAAAGKRVVAAGFDGKLFRYDWQQQTWQYTQTNWWEWFQGITISPLGETYVVGGIGYQNGRILKIEATGVILQVDSFDFELTDICFADAQTGFACGYGAILKTDDAGQSWTQLFIKGDYYKSLFIQQDRTIWAVGYNGSILQSKDDGAHWTKVRTGGNLVKKQWRLRDIAFKNIEEGVAVGDKGLIVYTNDGGESWEQITSPVNTDLYAISYQEGGIAWIVGAQGILIRMKL